MADDASVRRLASIVAIDMAGYSRRTEADEASAIGAVTALKARVTAAVLAHGGRVFNTAGDGFMLEFPTVSGALAAAEEIAGSADPPVRVGVHVGEVSVIETGDLLGHGVNVAARIQQMASPGAVLVSGDVKRAVRGLLGERLRPQGSVKLDKMRETLPVFALAPAHGGTAKGRRLKLKTPLVVGTAVVGPLSAVALLAFHPWRQEQVAPSTPRPAIAVLGFQPVGGGSEGKALAAALPRRVADALSQYDLIVIGPSAGGPGAADFVVEGRVTDNDGSLHVVADLSDARSHVLVYSFDTAVPVGPNGDVASQVANHVAVSLDPTKFSNDLGGKLTAADYALIARANDGIDRWDPPAVLDQTRELAARHPSDGELQASVAIAAIYAAKVEPAGQKPERMQLARASIAEAERLSPRSALLQIARLMLLNGPLAYAEQERLYRKALSLNPGLHVTYNGLGNVLLSVGRTEEGATLIKRSVQLDPMSGLVNADAVKELVAAGQFDDARRTQAREERIWPDSPWILGGKYSFALEAGDTQAALALDRQFHMRQQWPLTFEAVLAHDPKYIDRFVNDCIAEFRRSVWRDEDAVCLTELVKFGRLDDAFRLAPLAYPDNRAFAAADSDAWISRPPPALDPAWLFSPTMKPFRDDPRFWNVAERAGLVHYWRSTGSWPDFCQAQLDRCKRQAAAVASS